jgi:hypothetical protein
VALPPGGIADSPDGDRKRLLQRADSFAIGKGMREKKESDEIDEFDDAMESVISKTKQVDTQAAEADEQKRELVEHRETHAQLEAERRGSSSPSHQPFLGMSILPGITGPNQAISQTPESHSKRRSGGITENDNSLIESVSPELLQGLRAAGLKSPLATLDDPRLASSAEGLKPDFVMSLRSNERVYVWSQNLCHQVVSIGLHESKLESAVGETVEILTRRGKIDQKVSHKRPAPSADFPSQDS